VGAPVRLLVAVLAVAIGCLACASYRGARLYQEGTAALDRGEVERAVADLEQAARLVPQASEIQNHLGLAYAAAGRDADALDAFRSAVALDCDNQAAAHNLRRAEGARAALQP
jgi:Flp pilus assembly protein TadD